MKLKIRRFPPDMAKVSKRHLTSFIHEVLTIAEDDGVWNDQEYAQQELPGFFEPVDE
jgi:hypothetical protein